ncbi:MAG: hypothetical protein FJ317_09170 [SAR202 cluster bacterium]|nr:hypothetical protein [SAR202 cluster bacterium]
MRKSVFIPGVLIILLTLVSAACGAESPAVASTPTVASTQPVRTPTLITASPSPTAVSAATATPVVATATAHAASAATPTPVAATATPVPNPFADVPGIVDPDNQGWPRTVVGLNGEVVISQQPTRIHTVSLGHDEVTYALVPAERVVAVGTFTQDPIYSNVARLAALVPGIGRQAEQIVAQDPDIVFASPFSRAELIQSLENVGITVVQTEIHNDAAGRIQDILFMGYALGEEARAIELAREVGERYEALTLAVKDARQQSEKPKVLALSFYSDKYYVAGAGATEGAIIESAGGVNVAAEAGLTGSPTVSLEGVIAMNPEVIIIPQPANSGGDDLKALLLIDPALSEIPAVQSGRIYVVSPKFYTTLSFWNLRGAEELAKLLWPGQLGGREYQPFSFPE